MITTKDVREFIKTISGAEHYYIGKLDNKLDKSIGIYNLKGSGSQPQAIGGESTYAFTGISILIHWNRNADETEKAALSLYEQLRTVKDVIINGHIVYMIQLLVPEPIDVGTDEKGVYERVIELKIYYERK